MEIEKKLWKCAQLCSDNWQIHSRVVIIPREGPMFFSIEGRGGLIPKQHERDSTWLYVDCAKREVRYYAADESPHNGDHYDCVRGELDWDTAAPAILKMIEPHAVEAMMRIEQKEREDAERERLRAKIYE